VTTTVTYSNWRYTVGAACCHSTGQNYKYGVTQSADVTTSTSTSTPNYNFQVTQADTPSLTTYTYTPNAHYAVTQSDVATTTVTTVVPPTATTLGNTFSCYSSAGSAVTSDYTCPSGTTCSIGSATDQALCPSGQRYQSLGTLNTIVTVPTSPAVYTTDTATYNADEWARFMYQKGIPVSGSAVNAFVTTYTVDVYGIKPNGVQSSLLSSMAHNGGGGYFAATNATQITTDLANIFSEIQAKNSTFASAALPISATQRSSNDNQVYIGMFRPDQKSFPRWFGNMKRYQLGVVSGGYIDLVDANGTAAVSATSGFLTPCAQSFWTTDSGNYWANIDAFGTVSPTVFFTQATTPGSAWATLGDDTKLAKGGCTTLGAAYSDLPDGPNVEKGGAAQVLRSASTRTVQTLKNSTLVSFTSANTGLSTNLTNFVLGQDVTGELGGVASSANRPSIHGSVIHSRPLPVDYGPVKKKVRVFYGSNDGVYHAIDVTDTPYPTASTPSTSFAAAESWAFVAPESYGFLERQLDNTPVVQSPYPTPAGQAATAGTHGDFSFDGSTGLYQSFNGTDSTNVWIYPSMRRGGRMIYAFDASSATTSPTFKWRLGCPHLNDNSGCVSPDGTDVSAIGQTWSTPVVAFLGGYLVNDKPAPVVIVGGGYDACEDADSNPSAVGFCASPMGAKVYVLDANTGYVIKSFSTDRSVAGDVTLVNIDSDLAGIVDAAYVADTGGNLYRIDFATNNSGSYTGLAPSAWTITKVAYTTGASRKFLFAPAALAYKNQVYVAIGSGDREHPTALSYPYTQPVVNRAYVYLDDPTTKPGTPTNLDTMSNKTALTENTCGSSALLTPADKGWFLDLTANNNGVGGEQTVTSALISGGLVAFSTSLPVSGASCSVSTGLAYGYWLNLLNGSGAINSSSNCGGSRSSLFVGGGLVPSPVSGMVTIGGVLQNVIIGAAKLDGSASTPIGGQLLNPKINRTRTPLYWKTSTDTH